jgi:hypothetical protein
MKRMIAPNRGMVQPAAFFNTPVAREKRCQSEEHMDSKHQAAQRFRESDGTAKLEEALDKRCAPCPAPGSHTSSRAVMPSKSMGAFGIRITWI